ncbi:MAG: hypothetical protein N2C14_33255, partial [Planctomycetales bacterium]
MHRSAIGIIVSLYLCHASQPISGAERDLRGSEKELLMTFVGENKVIAPSRDRLQIWDAITGERIHILGGVEIDRYWLGREEKIAVGRNSVLFSLKDSRLQVLDVENGEILLNHRPSEKEGGATGVPAISSDGQYVAYPRSVIEGKTTFGNDVVRKPECAVLTVRWKRLVAILPMSHPHPRRPRDGRSRTQILQYSPKDYTLATSLQDVVMLWDGATGRKLHCLKRHKNQVESCDFSADGPRLATADYDGLIC